MENSYLQYRKLRDKDQSKQKRDDLRIISHNREILMDWKGHCNFEFIGAVNVFFIYTSITRIS